MQQIQLKLIQTNVNETQLTTVKIEMNIIINHILIIQKTRNATLINLTKEEITITQDHQLIIIHLIKITIIAPKPTAKSNHFTFKDDLKRFTRRLQIKEVFNDISVEDNSLVYKPSTKPVRTNNSDLQQLITEIEYIDPNYQTFTDNLTKEERASINKLRENDDIILKKSDKGGGWQ